MLGLRDGQGGRRVDNSVNGKFSAYTPGLEWAPVGNIELRGNATRSLRALALVELYMPVSSSFTQVADPCSAGNLSSGPRRDARLANCARFFADYDLPTDGSWTSGATGSAVQGSAQGDLNLRNEWSNARNAAFVLHPRRLDDLELAVDWVDIRIDNSITRTAPGSAQPGQITFVRTGYANGSFQSMAGVTLATSYTQGQIGSPKDSAQLDLDWRRGAFGAHWQSNYIGAVVYNRTFNADSRDVLVLMRTGCTICR